MYPHIALFEDNVLVLWASWGCIKNEPDCGLLNTGIIGNIEAKQGNYIVKLLFNDPGPVIFLVLALVPVPVPVPSQNDNSYSRRFIRNQGVKIKLSNSL